MIRASDQLAAYIERGGDAPQAIKSWFNMWKYKRACYVLEGKTEAIQRKRLEEIPEHHKVKVYEEAKRLYEYRAS